MVDVSKTPDWRSRNRHRFVAVYVILSLWTMVIAGRLVQLQVVQKAHWDLKASEQQQGEISVAARRGDILDRHTRVLAYSVNADSVCAHPAEVKDPRATAAALCGALHDCAPQDQEQLTRRLQPGKGKYLVYVRRFAAPDQVDRIKRLKLPGIDFQPEPHRYYPNRELAAHLLGWVGESDKQENAGLEWGLGGLESTYNSKIQGRFGKLHVAKAGDRWIYNRSGEPPQPGESLVLTIDAQLQHIAERELARAIEENNAPSGSIVINGPDDG